MAVVLAVVYGVNLVRTSMDAADICAITPTPGAGDTSTAEPSVVPWRWTCVYTDDDGNELRVAHSRERWPW